MSMHSRFSMEGGENINSKQHNWRNNMESGILETWKFVAQQI